jgi:hypothetical protein
MALDREAQRLRQRLEDVLGEGRSAEARAESRAAFEAELSAFFEAAERGEDMVLDRASALEGRLILREIDRFLLELTDQDADPRPEPPTEAERAAHREAVERLLGLGVLRSRAATVTAAPVIAQSRATQPEPTPEARPLDMGDPQAYRSPYKVGADLPRSVLGELLLPRRTSQEGER